MDKSNNESINIEINLRRAKWLISYSCNSDRNRITSRLQSLSKNLDLYSCKFGYNEKFRFQYNFGGPALIILSYRDFQMKTL